jgi:hypothetical protein
LGGTATFSTRACVFSLALGHERADDSTCDLKVIGMKPEAVDIETEHTTGRLPPRNPAADSTTKYRDKEGLER